MPLTTIGSFVMDVSHVIVSHVRYGSIYDLTRSASVCSDSDFSAFGNLKPNQEQQLDLQHGRFVKQD